ncbi:helix-turn-helix transcriptional regulator [Alcaligenaceae bacterium]|nr:helix-turn-helix transcriptional regulator [Alcaligenaceae bacterium]
MSIARTPRVDGEETRGRLKSEAQRLFALHGLDGVSIKDILAAAEVRNRASVHYYFGSKEALLEELLVEGAQKIDAARQIMVNDIETAGNSKDVRAVLGALVKPVLEFSQSEEGRHTYMRFVANMQLNHRDFFRATLGDKWNGGYRRCLAMLRESLSYLPVPVLEQRLSIMGIYSNALLSAMEASTDPMNKGSSFWNGPHSFHNMMDTLQAVLECHPSNATAASLDKPKV